MNDLPSGPNQRVTDSWVKTCLLWIFPHSVRPNHVTAARFVLTPVVLVLLYYDLMGWAFGVFCVAVCTDFIDGAMARTRGQISKIGMVIDPVADKLLIGATLAWVTYSNTSDIPLSTLVVVTVILASIALEFLFMGIGIAMGRPGYRVSPANVFGKAKMVVQSIAVILFLIAAMFDFHTMLVASTYLLWLAVFLAVLSGAKHVQQAVASRKTGQANQ